jgi:hypothetical protein
MDAFHHIAQAAAVLLMLELLVVLIVFLAISGGLAFGLRWGRGKLGPLLEKANGYLAMVPKYTRVGTDYAAKPVIMAGGFAETVKTTVAALERRVREARAAQAAKRRGTGPPAPPGDDPTDSIEPLSTT